METTRPADRAAAPAAEDFTHAHRSDRRTTGGREPMRTCVGCRRTRPQAGMVRCVLGPEGVASVSRTAAGRGAWLCAVTCFAPAVKRKGFERAWRRPVPVGALDDLHSQISNVFESTRTQMREWTAAGSASDGPTPTKG